MIVFYIYDETVGWGVHTSAYSGGEFNFFAPSETLMFVPGNYQEMMEDYG